MTMSTLAEPEELRAKYSSADRDSMAKAGSAMSDGSYPIADESDLKKAIKAVGRGNASHDAIRAHIIKRAKDLKLSSLVPSNWAKDGSLKEAAGAWSTDEERETATDMFTALAQAVDDAYGAGSDWGYYCWVQDFDEERVIFQAGSQLLSAPYTVEPEGPVTLGEAVMVRPITDYVESSRDERAECSTCSGSGKIRGGKVDCPDCGGSGDTAADRDPATPITLHTNIALDGRVVADAVRRFALAPRTTEWRRSKVPSRGETERRNFTLADLELRGDPTDDSLTLVGYASVTGTAYSVGHYEETIARGAFKRTLGNPDLDVQLLVNHAGLPLARTTSGTLRLSEDERGLKVEADLDPTDPDVLALVPKMRRGDVTEMSFAFRAIDQDWSDDYSQRLIKSVDIQRGDVSIVAYGASHTTMAALRSEALVAEIRSLGFDAFLGALVEWRDFTLLPIEDRTGKALSAETMEILTRVLTLVASADEAVDEAQPLLADLMGVPNPDTSDEAVGGAEMNAEDETTETRDEAAEAASEPESTPEPVAPRPLAPNRSAQYFLWLQAERNRKAA